MLVYVGKPRLIEGGASWSRWGFVLDFKGMVFKGVHTTGEVQDGILGHRNKMNQVLFRFIFYLEKRDYRYLISRLTVIHWFN